jgi:two-component system response regulator HydG
VEDLPDRVQDYKESKLVVTSDDESELLTMDEVERRYIVHVLKAVRGNKTMASRILGLDRKTLYRRLEKHSIDTEALTDSDQ